MQIKEAKEIIKNIINYKDDLKNIFIIKKIKDLKENQIDYIYDYFVNKREPIDKSIVSKIEAVCPSKDIQNIVFKKKIILWVNTLKYADISKKMNYCTIEIKKGKINNKAAFIISRLDELYI